ncbi:hypothetical protein Pmani_017125 [Petrolisthes manimaculis]|uniref:Very-long-chain (3R)-3-hydroxyacyl-CoA dehydratase n=1 Tax=Petrolisthes manimaculis TaxID=1843537 RepID=A0AAE1PP11_9EUCA|nr:hypothetical protein Pmani_017125 [Petrolisthes manimaculis]
MSSKTKSKPSDPFSPGNVYLIFYNVFLSLGWLIVLIQTVHHLVFDLGSIDGLWDNTSNVLKIFQSLAFLEIIHSAVGLVSSGVGVVLPQVFSRLTVLWLVLASFPETHKSIGLPMLLIAWSVTEVIRYAFYFLNILKQVPYVVSYLRYTLFMGLYPLGVTGELLVMITALPIIAKTKAFSVTLPNTLNFTFDFYWVLIIIMLLYIPIFPMLYLHMFAQRKKVLGPTHIKKD